MTFLYTVWVRLSIVTLLCNYAFAESLLSPIIKQNIAAYTPETLEWPEESYDEWIHRVVRYQESLEPFKKCEIGWKIFERCSEQGPLPSNAAPRNDGTGKDQPSNIVTSNSVTSNHVIGNDPLTWKNLQMLCGEQEQERSVYVAHLVDRTSTELGRVTLCARVAQPTDDLNELNKRQSCIRLLLENRNLFQLLDSHFSSFKKSENVFLSFWADDPFKSWVIPRKPSQSNFFRIPYITQLAESIGESLEKSVPFLTAMTVLQQGEKIISCLLAGLTTVALPTYGVLQLAQGTSKRPIKDNAANDFLSDVAKRLVGTSKRPIKDNAAYDFLSEVAQRLVGTGGPICTISSYIPSPTVQYLAYVLAGVYAADQTQRLFGTARGNFTISRCLQKKMQHVAQCIHAAEAISIALTTHPEFRLPSGVDIQALIQNLKTSNMAIEELWTLLDSNTFKGEPSTIANYGKILRAYRLMHEHMQDLEPLLCALGELDVSLSCARLYKEFEHQRVRYSFAQYRVDSDEPLIILTDLWSPFIKPSFVVPNSIELGITKGGRNLIITGPNEGGKSTFVKSIAIALILAQSIGIVPATEAALTPFSYIATYLNITDDNGKSLFEAQVQRTKHILDHIDAMATNRYSFVLIDELFNGTEAGIGQAASCSIADYLSKNPQVISVFPTHFQQLTTLEESGRSVNYKVSAVLDEQGNIRYPFKIERGISLQNTVLSILRSEGFNQTILDYTAKRLASNTK